MLSKNIPVVGGALIDAIWFTNPMFYPLGGSVVTNIWGQMKSAAEAGNKKVGVVLCTEIAACAQAQPLFTKNATDVGMQMVYNALASQTQASYTAECLAAKNAGAEAVATSPTPWSCAGLRPPELQPRSGSAPTWARPRPLIKQRPRSARRSAPPSDWICLDTTIQAAKDLNAALKQYHPEYAVRAAASTTSSARAVHAWAGGIEFAKAITNANVAADRDRHQRGRHQGPVDVPRETLGGIAPPLTFSDGTKPTRR